jgi:CobQ-like glutamine amidotransferase family enzyme
MVVEILFQEVCGLYGDSQNPTYLQATLPDAEFVFTSLTDTPYFLNNTPDLIYIGCMSESTQRRVISKLMPLKSRICELVDAGVPILATGNAGEIFAKHIDYVTEKLSVDGLGIFDLSVKTDLFKRYNGMVLGQLEDIKIVGFRSQFSFIYGDNSNCYFIKCLRGDGIHPGSNLEGMRKNNLICTQLIGPILPLNPLFCEYFIRLTGLDVSAAYRDTAMDAYTQRLQEFSDPKVSFQHN